MSTGFEVRSPRADEAAAIAGVHVAGWRETYGALLPSGYLDAAHERMRLDMWTRILDRADPLHRVRVGADAAGRMIGFGMSGASLPDAFGEPPRERQLYTLYVLAEAHGTGVGQALLDVILGPAPALLWVAQENPPRDRVLPAQRLRLRRDHAHRPRAAGARRGAHGAVTPVSSPDRPGTP